MSNIFEQIDDDVGKMVLEAKEIAVLGLSSQPAKDSYRVASYMQMQGSIIIPITTNQFVDRILGEKVYRDLISVPYDYDILCVFRPSMEIPNIVNAYFSAPYQAPLIWFQSGIFDQESYARVEESGLRCVMDKCLMVEHQKLLAAEC